MSLKFYITLFLTLFAALIALLLLEDPEQVKSVAFSPAFLVGSFGIVGYYMMESEKRYIPDLGVLLLIIAWAIGVWHAFHLAGELLEDYNIKIVTKWGNK